jgi:hypothetical protein
MEAEKKAAPAAAERKAAPSKPNKATTEQFVPGQTRCRFCDNSVAVRHTEKQISGDKTKLIITRSVKCNGPRRHTYEHVEEKKVK